MEEIIQPQVCSGQIRIYHLPQLLYRNLRLAVQYFPQFPTISRSAVQCCCWWILIMMIIVQVSPPVPPVLTELAMFVHNQQHLAPPAPVRIKSTEFYLKGNSQLIEN